MALIVFVMALTEAGAKALALIAQERRMQEAADSGDMSTNDLCRWLSDAVRDNRPSGSWCYYVDFIGDGESGVVQYCCDGSGTMQCPYTITQSNGKIAVSLDMSKSVQVYQTTNYIPVGEDNGYGALEAAELYTKSGEIPLCERTITKAERDDMPAGDFAGKGKSFPIKKPGDVKAAVQSIGRAGASNHPPGKLKGNIKKIAKKKGFPLPKSLQDDAETTEAARVAEAGKRHNKTDQALIQTIHDHSVALGADPTVAPTANDNNVDEASKGAQAMHDKATTQTAHDAAVKMGATCPDDCEYGDDADDDDTDADESAVLELVGDVIPLREGAVGQDGTAYLKLISPGWGSCGFYPPDVLERDGPKVFTAGTKNFWDHQTAAEEAARPEGSLRDLASVLTEDAHYESNGPAGAGLYAKANVFEQFRQPVDSLAKHIGMSIRASGKAKEGKAPDGKSGKIIEQLTHGLSVDYVTTPGAGGQILQLFEAARGRVAPTTTNLQENDMDAAELRKLQESVTAVQAENRKLRERQALTDAGGAVAEYFRTVQVSEAIRVRITDRVLAGTIPVTEAGDLDRAKVKTFAEAQLTEELAFLGRLNPQMVVGMGPKVAAGQLTEAQRAEQKERAKTQKKALKESNRRFASLMGFGENLSKRGRKILTEGRSAFDVNYNSRNRGALVTSGGGSLPGLEA